MLDLELILNLQVVVLQGICRVQFNFFQNPSHTLLAFPGILYVHSNCVQTWNSFFSPHYTCHYSKVIPRAHVVTKLSANSQMLSKTTGLLVGNFVFYELFIWNLLLLGLRWWAIPSPILFPSAKNTAIPTCQFLPWVFIDLHLDLTQTLHLCVAYIQSKHNAQDTVYSEGFSMLCSLDRCPSGPCCFNGSLLE